MESLDILGRSKSMVRNILEHIEYIEPVITLIPDDKSVVQNILENVEYIQPDTTLSSDPGMCNDCIELELHDMCDDCKDVNGT
jgi:hypothetical protein